MHGCKAGASWFGKRPARSLSCRHDRKRAPAGVSVQWSGTTMPGCDRRWDLAAGGKTKGARNAQRREVMRNAISSQRTSAEKQIRSGCSLRRGANSLPRPVCPSPDLLHPRRSGGRKGVEMRRRRPAAAPSARTGDPDRDSRRPRIGMLRPESPSAGSVFETHETLPAPPLDARRCAGSRAEQPAGARPSGSRVSRAPRLP
jgi:hypothetical protein